jgi:hypothetical protein
VVGTRPPGGTLVLRGSKVAIRVRVGPGDIERLTVFTNCG